MRRKGRVITRLWGGNGVAERCDVQAASGEIIPCVAKRIQCPQDRSVDAKRKRKSYHNELAFYRDVAPELLRLHPGAVPRPVELSAEKDTITLVLADVTREYPVKREMLSPQQTRTALQWLAAFHAQYWESPDKHRGLARCGSYWFLGTRPDELRRIDPHKYKRLLRCAPALEARLKGVVFERGQRRYSPRYLTLIHGDFKPANLQFSRDGSRCVAYDFQYVGRGYGAVDVCYLLHPDGLHEQEMVRYYHQALQAALAPGCAAPTLANLIQLMELSYLDFYRFLLGWYYPNRRPPAELERAAMGVLTKIDGGKLLSPQGYYDAVAGAYPLVESDPNPRVLANPSKCGILG